MKKIIASTSLILLIAAACGYQDHTRKGFDPQITLSSQDSEPLSISNAEFLEYEENLESFYSDRGVQFSLGDIQKDELITDIITYYNSEALKKMTDETIISKVANQALTFYKTILKDNQNKPFELNVRMMSVLDNNDSALISDYDLENFFQGKVIFLGELMSLEEIAKKIILE